jgi:hypothetical protein
MGRKETHTNFCGGTLFEKGHFEEKRQDDRNSSKYTSKKIEEEDGR